VQVQVCEWVGGWGVRWFQSLLICPFVYIHPQQTAPVSCTIALYPSHNVSIFILYIYIDPYLY
jgi:hypothetical protein